MPYFFYSRVHQEHQSCPVRKVRYMIQWFNMLIFSSYTIESKIGKSTMKHYNLFSMNTDVYAFFIFFFTLFLIFFGGFLYSRIYEFWNYFFIPNLHSLNGSLFPSKQPSVSAVPSRWTRHVLYVGIFPFASLLTLSSALGKLNNF